MSGVFKTGKSDCSGEMEVKVGEHSRKKKKGQPTCLGGVLWSWGAAGAGFCIGGGLGVPAQEKKKMST